MLQYMAISCRQRLLLLMLPALIENEFSSHTGGVKGAKEVGKKVKNVHIKSNYDCFGLKESLITIINAKNV